VISRFRENRINLLILVAKLFYYIKHGYLVERATVARFQDRKNLAESSRKVPEEGSRNLCEECADNKVFARTNDDEGRRMNIMPERQSIDRLHSIRIKSDILREVKSEEIFNIGSRQSVFQL